MKRAVYLILTSTLALFLNSCAFGGDETASRTESIEEAPVVVAETPVEAPKEKVKVVQPVAKKKKVAKKAAVVATTAAVVAEPVVEAVVAPAPTPAPKPKPKPAAKKVVATPAPVAKQEPTPAPAESNKKSKKEKVKKEKEPKQPKEDKGPSKFSQNFTWGFSGGANFSNMAEDTKVRVSFVGGLFAEYALGEKWALVLEGQYSDQGAQVYVLKQDGMVKYRHFNGLKYINVPIMAQWNIHNRFNLKFGVQGGYLMSAKYKWRKMTRFESWIIEDGYTDYDIAIPVALTYNFPSGIYFEGRYTHGLTTITTETANPLDQMPDYKNRTYSLSIGYKF